MTTISTPLIQYDSQNSLAIAIDDLCKRTQPVKSANKKVGRVVLKSGAFLLPAAGRTFFIPIAINFGIYVARIISGGGIPGNSTGNSTGGEVSTESEIIGALCAMGNIVAFATLGFWSMRGVVDEFLAPRTRSEMQLIKSQSGGIKTRYKITILVCSAGGAFAAQLPLSFAVARYNEGVWKIVGFVTVMIANGLFPWRSLQLSMEALVKRFQERQYGDLVSLRNKIIGLLIRNRDIFEKNTSADKILILAQINQTRQVSTREERVEQFVCVLLNIVPKPSRRPEWQKKIRDCLSTAGQGIGFIAAAFLTYALSEYSYHSSIRQVSPHPAVGITLAGLTGAGWLYLSTQTFMNTFSSYLETTWDLITCHRETRINEQLRTKTTFALATLAIVTNLLAAGPTYYIWHDMPDASEGKKTAYEIGVTSVLFFLLLGSLMDVVNDIIMNHISMKGSKEEKDILALRQNFTKMIQLLKESSLLNFAHFIRSNESQRKNICGCLGIEEGKIKRYADTVISISTQANPS